MRSTTTTFKYILKPPERFLMPVHIEDIGTGIHRMYRMSRMHDRTDRMPVSIVLHCSLAATGWDMETQSAA